MRFFEMKWDEMGWNGILWDEMGWNGILDGFLRFFLSFILNDGGIWISTSLLLDWGGIYLPLNGERLPFSSFSSFSSFPGETMRKPKGKNPSTASQWIGNSTRRPRDFVLNFFGIFSNFLEEKFHRDWRNRLKILSMNLERILIIQGWWKNPRNP